MANIELLTWFGNLLNFLVFAFVSISVVNTRCFDIFQLSLTLGGILVSIFIQMVSIMYRTQKDAK